VTHQIIRRFQVEGEVDSDSYFIQTQETCKKTLVSQMKDEGWIPLLDLDPVWRSTLSEKGTYTFDYTMHGIYIGEDSWQYDGMLGTKLIQSIRPNK